MDQRMIDQSYELLLSARDSTGTSTTKHTFAIPKQAPKRVRHQKAPASFGHAGVTATASAYGHMIQITRYVGERSGNPSGFIRAELSEWAIVHPYSALQRLRKLDLASVDPNDGLHLKLSGAEIHSQELPQMSFVHNRWPRYKFKESGAMDEVQYLVSDDTVYQMYKFKISRDDSSREIKFSVNLSLMDLGLTLDDNTVKGHKVTRQESYREKSENTDSPNKNHFEDSPDTDSETDGFDIENTFGDNLGSRSPRQIDYEDLDTCRANPFLCFSTPVKTQDREQEIGLFLSPFVGNRLQRPVLIKGRVYKFTVDNESWEEIVKKGEDKLHVTFAYTLKLLPSDSSSVTSPVSDKNLRTAQETLQKQFEISQLSHDPHLDFIFWRNVENILSVCSIPIGHEFGLSPDEQRLSNDIPSVALTCGDVSDHRILVKASFHAFRLLVLAMKKIRDIFKNEKSDTKICSRTEKSCKHSACATYWRIWRICNGHVRWVLEQWAPNFIDEQERLESMKTSKKRTAHGCVAEEDGKVMLALDVHTDVALQIIKLGEFLTVSDDEPTFFAFDTSDYMQKIATSWLEDVAKLKKNGLHMFPRSTRRGIAKFHLVDHALIWWVMKSAEKLELNLRPTVTFDSRESSKHQPPLSVSEQFRRNIVKIFGVADTITHRKALATSRSITEARVTLYPEDITIFYAVECGLFFKDDTQEKISQWATTENCQLYSQDADDAGLYQPIHFPLAVILASQGIATTAMDPHELYTKAKSTLLNRSSPNGLLRTPLHLADKRMENDDEAFLQLYWTDTFEIPYILCKYQERANMHMSQRFTSATTANEPKSRSIPAATPMEFNVQLDNRVDQENVVEISGDWLYDEPKFLGIRPDLSEQAFSKFEAENQAVLGNCLKEWHKRSRLYAKEGTKVADENIKCMIYDVARGGQSNASEDTDNKQQKSPQTNSSSLRDRLKAERTRKNAKKRLIQIFQATTTTALHCSLSSVEKKDTALFFNRHSLYQKHFHEETAAVPNKWVTELHLSFWELSLAEDCQNDSIFPQEDKIEFSMLRNGKYEDGWVRRAVTSFRFDGDFLDRYWTCHFIEHNSTKHDIEIKKLDVTDEMKESHWHQRRILELVLFDRILKGMLKAANGFLKEAKQQVQRSFNPVKKPDTSGQSESILKDALTLLEAQSTEKFLSTSKLCHRVQHLLQAIVEDLDGNLSTIEKWEDREAKRASRRPRWTHNDETKYRDIISDWQASNEHGIFDLRQCRKRIDAYNTSLAKKLEDLGNELEIRGAEDIRLFTYVTAFFLPIGFATGIFSMSEAPSAATLGGMIVTGLVFLLFTVIALVNARSLERWIWEPTMDACKKLTRPSIHMAAKPSDAVSSAARFGHAHEESMVHQRPQPEASQDQGGPLGKKWWIWLWQSFRGEGRQTAEPFGA